MIAPIEKIVRQLPINRLIIEFQPEGQAHLSVTAFGPGIEPLLVRPPAGAPEGQQWLLALRAPRGRCYALDADMKDLVLIDEERAAIRNAAWA